MNKDKGTMKVFDCEYCSCEFKARVATSAGEKHSKVSTQVKCPFCGNYLPNDSGKDKSKARGDKIGSKQ